MTLRDQLQAEAAPKVRARLKALALKALADADYDRDGGFQFARQFGGRTWTVVFTRKPALVRDTGGEVVGVEVWIRLLRGVAEVPIDGHLRFINPPVLVPDGGSEAATDEDGAARQRPTYTENPLAALRDIVLDEVRRQVQALR